MKSLVLASNQFYLVKWLGYALGHNSWGLESNLSAEVPGVYWDAVAESDNSHAMVLSLTTKSQLCISI